MRIRSWLAAATVSLTAATTLIPAPASAADAPYKVLVFSKTAGFRHSSIPNGIAAIQSLGAANNFTVTATEDAAAFTTANLAQFQTVVFLSTTGDVLNDTQQTAFESYIRGGGGYVGVHAAADTEYGWAFYGTLVGAWFSSHPAIQQATIAVEDRTHPATAHLGATWARTDEWYNYQTNPRSSARVLASLTESSYSGGTMGDHPITWCKTIDNGRSFYTGLGHTEASYTEAAFTSLLLGALRYTAKRVDGNCAPSTPPASSVYQGESWSATSGVQVANHAPAVGGRTAGYIDPNDWISYTGVNLATARGALVRVSSAGAGGTVEFRAGSATGTLLGTVSVPNTGSWDTFRDVFTPLASNSSSTLYLVFKGTGSSLFDLDQFTLTRTATTRQGEAWSSTGGLQVAAHGPAVGGQTAGFVDNNDWAGYTGLSLASAAGVRVRWSSAGAGGTIEFRAGSQTGTLLGTLAVTNTGSWDTFREASVPLAPNASTSLFLVFRGGSGSLFDVDEFTLHAL
ncbi:ThuA domain-containing protein [Dactylosporangium sp. AC04546]|uniref:ThuA domain-containing protein n=1 Tax=Dactylosporangium sp. AC04546 TaxID=2862460 RepID=UPI001EDD01C8|nr:ThuA domain-containing protein [Dactylosporangium sp. AC04546]WVK82491.1 ThuA domain-containing protein [Dactylosporangium sp. AC04546]